VTARGEDKGDRGIQPDAKEQVPPHSTVIASGALPDHSTVDCGAAKEQGAIPKMDERSQGKLHLLLHFRPIDLCPVGNYDEHIPSRGCRVAVGSVDV
jgi:hypothetical protein